MPAFYMLSLRDEREYAKMIENAKMHTDTERKMVAKKNIAVIVSGVFVYAGLALHCMHCNGRRHFTSGNRFGRKAS